MVINLCFRTRAIIKTMDAVISTILTDAFTFDLRTKQLIFIAQLFFLHRFKQGIVSKMSKMSNSIQETPIKRFEKKTFSENYFFLLYLYTYIEISWTYWTMPLKPLYLKVFRCPFLCPCPFFTLDNLDISAKSVHQRAAAHLVPLDLLPAPADQSPCCSDCRYLLTECERNSR